MGIVVAAFTIILAVTGLILNHEPRLNLNKVQVTSAWVLNWYGMEGVNAETKGINLNGQWLILVEDQLYLDLKSVGALSAPVVGAISLPDMFLVADEFQLTLLTREGDLIERFVPNGVTGRFTALGNHGEAIILQTQAGAYQSDPQLLHWERTETNAGSWSKLTPLPGDVAANLSRELTGGGLPLYRIILDLHSGRLFSTAGRLAMDGAALLLIVLSITGLWIWWPRS